MNIVILGIDLGKTTCSVVGLDADGRVVLRRRLRRDDVRSQRIFIGPSARRLPLCRAVLPEHATGKPLRDTELLPDVVDAGTAAGGA